MRSAAFARLVTRWNRYWFAPAAYVDLAVCRVALVSMQMYLLLAARVYNVSRLEELAGLPDSLYDPLPLFKVFSFSWDGAFRPSFAVLVIVYACTLLFGTLGLVGLRTNVSILLFAVGNFFLQSFSYSFGDFHHPEALMMIALVVLGLGPSGAALSIDSLIGKYRRGAEQRQVNRTRDAPPSNARCSQFARWPILVIQWMMALIYLDAAVNKLYRSGFDWMNGYTLRWNLYTHGHGRGSELAIWMADHHALSVGFSWLTVLWEGTFIFAVVIPVLALVYVPIGFAMHVGMCVTRVACFYQFLAAYSVFVPWSHLSRAAKTMALRSWTPGRQGTVFTAAEHPAPPGKPIIHPVRKWPNERNGKDPADPTATGQN